MTLTGAPETPPQLAGIALGDYVPGLYTAVAILAALHHRGRNGQGQYIDISMQDCIFHTTAVEKMPRYYLDGENPARRGNRGQVYRARDGHLIISVGNIGQWNNFLRVIEREDLIGVEKYGTWNQREAHFDELLPIIEHWTTQRDVGEIVAILSDAHLPCSPIPSYDEVLSDPHLASRDMYVEVEQVISGKVKVPGSPFKLSETPGDPRRAAPFLGEHNFEVYSGLLGLSEEELTALADEGIV